MKIVKETEVDDDFVDLEIDLEPEEERQILDVAKLLLPNEEDSQKLMQAGLEYMIVLGIICEVENNT